MVVRARVLLALGAFFFAVPVVLAHHGTSRFDMTHIVTLEGTVTRFEWINPHPVVHANVKNDQGKMDNWALECGSPLMLVRFGWSKTTVKPGDRVKIFGFRAKDGTPYMHLERLELPSGKALVGFP